MGRKLSYGMAINEALHQMMGADERVFILGEDVAKMGGDFGITKGIWENGRTASRIRHYPSQQFWVYPAGPLCAG